MPRVPAERGGRGRGRRHPHAAAAGGDGREVARGVRRVVLVPGEAREVLRGHAGIIVVLCAVRCVCVFFFVVSYSWPPDAFYVRGETESGVKLYRDVVFLVCTARSTAIVTVMYH